MNNNYSIFNVFGDHMVLQRDQPIRVSGTAPAGSWVKMELAGQTNTAFADSDSRWECVLGAFSAGGPYVMKLTSQAGAVVEFSDVMIGEVWLCSGQSNMEFTVDGGGCFYSLREGKELVASLNDVNLRLFQTQHALAPDGPCDNVAAGCKWKTATTADAVKVFSAIGCYFGKFLRENLGNVAIGIINSSWGGSMIEPWISEKAYVDAGLEVESQTAVNLRHGTNADDAKTDEINKKRIFELNKWLERFFATAPKTTAEALSSWALPSLDTTSWSVGKFKDISCSLKVGVSWCRKEFEISGEEGWPSGVLSIRAVNDCDETYFDGKKIGETSIDTPNYWDACRNYQVPAELLKPGRHVLAIRVINHFCTGGISANVALQCPQDQARNLDLTAGNWAKKSEFVADQKKIGIRPPIPSDSNGSRDSMQSATILYNGMIHPFTGYNIRGILWYQGCSNAGRPESYAIYQPLLVDSWRRAWKNMDMPFIVTQLSAFERHSPTDRLPDDYWTKLSADECGSFPPIREIQESVRGVHNEAMAVTIDIGDHSDIHPADKKTVAFRLFKLASKICYGYEGVVEGPHFESMKKEGGALRLSFSGTDGGLVAKGGTIGDHLFAVAGADGHYQWADASIDGDEIIVRSTAVNNPENVRYAWMMCPPNPNLYNGAGFPMIPFRTDK